MIDILLHLLIVLIVFGVAFWILEQVPLAEPWRRISRVVLGVIAVLILLSILLGLVNVAASPFHIRY